MNARVVNLSQSGVLFGPTGLETGAAVEVILSPPAHVTSLATGKQVCQGAVVRVTGTYQLVRTPVPVSRPPILDDAQRTVVERVARPGCGPVLVLAGPGTGKTTTLVEAIADRIERRGVDPSQILALTFSRKAAESLRDRVTARVGRTLANDLSRTFHAFAYGLVRAYAPAGMYDAPLRLQTDSK